MTLKGRRLIAVAATIIVYVGIGVILSLGNNHAEKSAVSSQIRWCKELKFLPTNQSAGDSTSYQKNLTALASFPGSGNTWMRYLLQQATGILTGSVYEDNVLQETSFPAENVCNSSVIVVKTHSFDPKVWTPFSKAILLVRDPEKAILAEFNRESGGHVGFAPEESYKARGGKLWQQYVSIKLEGWQVTNLNWIYFFTGSVKVVFYDDLVNDLERTLRGVLAFLEFPVDEKLLNCTLQNQKGKFQRKKRRLSFDPYTLAMHGEIAQCRRAVYKALGRDDI